jgi:N-acetylmuramoyl-L-alanine amidase
VIAIDPGHGGVDHGTENHAHGSMEKTYTLDVSARLKRRLEEQGYKVVMTRESDVDVPKQIRSEIANQAGADLLISIHFNSLYPNTKTTGVEVLSFPPRGQRSTNSWSPGQSNDSEQASSPVNRFDPWNTFLAGFMHRRLVDSLKSGDRGEKFEHLGVLRGLKCPGVLLESAFLSSDAEAEHLAKPEYRDKIAEAIVAGVADYAEALRRLQPASVAAPGPAPTRAAPTRPSQAP